MSLGDMFAKVKGLFSRDAAEESAVPPAPESTPPPSQPEAPSAPPPSEPWRS